MVGLGLGPGVLGYGASDFQRRLNWEEGDLLIFCVFVIYQGRGSSYTRF